jgi:hypothetical protein
VFGDAGASVLTRFSAVAGLLLRLAYDQQPSLPG